MEHCSTVGRTPDIQSIEPRFELCTDTSNLGQDCLLYNATFVNEYLVVDIVGHICTIWIFCVTRTVKNVEFTLQQMSYTYLSGNCLI